MAFATIQNGRKSVAEMMAENRRLSRQIKKDNETPTMKQRRKDLEKDPEAWLQYYGGKFMFPYPFGKAHKEIIHGTIEACRTGTGFSGAAPRGEGKTTVFRGVTVYLEAKRLVRFPVLVGWKHGDAKEAMKTWLRMFTESPNFVRDYWYICKPFLHSTHATALRNLCWEGELRPTGAMVDSTAKTIILPDGIGAIACRSAQGDAKGLNAVMPDGTVLRPDFVLFDDAQDPRKSGSPEMVRKTIDNLENVFLGMAGPQKRLTAAAACTVEADGDVSEHWLTRQGWKSVRVSRIEVWPCGGKGGDWPDDKAEIKHAWDDWNEHRLEHGEDAARKYYIEHKGELAGKCVVSWPERYDRDRGDPDAIYAALWDYYNLGASVFSRGQQNQPIKEGVTIYNLSVKTITDRTDHARNAGDVPDWALRVLAISDINPSYAITSVILAFGPDQRSAVLWYGTHPIGCPKELTDAEKKTEVMNQLAAHGRNIANLPCRPHGWMIDGGGTPESTVIDFAANSVRICGIPAITAFGRGGKAYRHPLRKETGISVHEQAYTKRVSGGRQWVIWNADYWREQSQRAWTGTLGAPGSCDLPKGSHRDFAEQIVSEQLIAKVELNGRWVYDWKHTPNQPHDYGDCMAMGYCFAAVNGIGTGGGTPNERPQRKRYTQAQLA
jgi:hypothetical protein